MGKTPTRNFSEVHKFLFFSFSPTHTTQSNTKIQMPGTSNGRAASRKATRNIREQTTFLSDTGKTRRSSDILGILDGSVTKKKSHKKDSNTPKEKLRFHNTRHHMFTINTLLCDLLTRSEQLVNEYFQDARPVDDEFFSNGGHKAQLWLEQCHRFQKMYGRPPKERWIRRYFHGSREITRSMYEAIQSDNAHHHTDEASKTPSDRPKKGQNSGPCHSVVTTWEHQNDFTEHPELFQHCDLAYWKESLQEFKRNGPAELVLGTNSALRRLIIEKGAEYFERFSLLQLKQIISLVPVSRTAKVENISFLDPEDDPELFRQDWEREFLKFSVGFLALELEDSSRERLSDSEQRLRIIDFLLNFLRHGGLFAPVPQYLQWMVPVDLNDVQTMQDPRLFEIYTQK